MNNPLSDNQLKLGFGLIEDGFKMKSFTPDNVATFSKDKLTVIIFPKN